MCKQKLISNKFDLKQTIRVLHTTIHLYLVYIENLLVYRYSDLLPTNTNE
jgi:hypothetical protein